MNKKAITILGAIFLLIVGTLGFLIYQKKGNKTSTTPPPPVAPPPAVVIAEPPPPEEVPPPEPPAEETPPAEEVPIELTPQAVKLTDVEVLSPVLFYQGNGIAFLNSNGQLFQADLEVSTQDFRLNNIRELTIPLKPGMKRVLWPQAGNNFIAEFQNGNRRSWSVYMSDKAEFIDLPSQVIALNWMPSGDKIMYVWLDKNGQATLNVANADNTGYQVVTDFWENDNDIAVSPDGKNILFYETQADRTPNKLNLVTADGKLFRSVVKDDYNTGSIWSLDSKKFAFFRGEPAGLMQLWVGNLFSGELKNVGLFSAPDKLVWSNDSQYLYAAGSTSPDGSNENLYKYNLATGDKQQFDLAGSADVREPFLLSTGDKLLFRNNKDGNKLYFVDVSGR